MKRLITFTALLALAMSGVLAAQSTLQRTYRNLQVDLWTDHDDGSNYYEGDDITIYFRASEDAYVTIYDLDTRGNVNLIFPSSPTDNNYVQGGEIYMIPETTDDYTLTLEGPPGNENIQMIASSEPYAVPDWEGPVSVYDDVWGFKYDNDNESFIDQVNNKYFPGADYAFDHVSFYVAPKYYYEPERTDCSGDCGNVYIDYPDGCEVYVDGVFYGYAPLYLPSIYLGRHRITVYWGTDIMYNDWIFVQLHDPFYLFPRPGYIYRYCWSHWYRNNGWNRYYGGPSQFRYKRNDFYHAGRPEARRGYEIVGNDHSGYKKSKFYVPAKETRIAQYKEKYGFDTRTKAFTETRYRPADAAGRKYFHSEERNTVRSQGEARRGTFEKGRTTEGRGTVQNRGESGRGSQGRATERRGDPKGNQGQKGTVQGRKPAGKSGGAVKKPQGESGGKGKSEPAAKPQENHGSKSNAPSAGSRPSGGSKGSSPAHSSGSPSKGRGKR